MVWKIFVTMVISRRKTKQCYFFLVLNSGQIIRSQGKEGKTKKTLRKGQAFDKSDDHL